MIMTESEKRIFINAVKKDIGAVVFGMEKTDGCVEYIIGEGHDECVDTLLEACGVETINDNDLVIEALEIVRDRYADHVWFADVCNDAIKRISALHERRIICLA